MSTKPLETIIDAAWATVPNTVEIFAYPPKNITITAAHVIVTSPQGVLLTKVRKRGWDIPGGHVEAGETSENAAIREVQEEAGITISSVTSIGHIRLTLHAPRPLNYRYPYPRGAQEIFAVRLPEALLPTPEMILECEEAAWFPVEVVKELCPGRNWVPLLDYAL